MSAPVIALRPPVMTRGQVQDFLAEDTVSIHGVAVWWTGDGDAPSAEPSREILVQTDDRITAVLAADELVRRQLSDSLCRVFGAVFVSEPMSVQLLGEPGGPTTWRPARRPGPNTVLVCRVAAGQDGAW